MFFQNMSSFPFISNIQPKIMSKNKHNKTVGSSVERSDDRIKQTGEVFTPMDVVYQMIDEIPTSVLKNKNSTFLDNSAGSGNFLYGLLMELSVYHDKQHIIDNMLFCVEKETDNYNEICHRLGVEPGHPHYVNDDALAYDYSFGEVSQTDLTQFMS